MRFVLMSPGPVMVPDSVLQAGAQQMENHLDHKFGNVVAECMRLLKPLFGTKGNAFFFSGSGRSANECALVNSLSPGDRILVLVNGLFGEIMASTATKMGFDAVVLGGQWLKPIDPEELEARLKADPDIKVVGMVHSETSTSNFNDIKNLVAVAKKYGKFTIVDAVSSFAGTPINMDELGIDIVATGSQKCLMSPPGLALVGVNPNAWDHINAVKTPRFMTDLRLMKQLAEDPMAQTVGTTAISLAKSLLTALRIITEDGQEATFERSAKASSATRAAADAMGLGWLPGAHTSVSPTVTTLKLPESVDAALLHNKMETEYATYLGKGLGQLEKSTLRIGHMGTEQTGATPEVIRRLEACLHKYGMTDAPEGAGYKVAEKILSQ